LLAAATSEKHRKGNFGISNHALFSLMKKEYAIMFELFLAFQRFSVTIIFALQGHNQGCGSGSWKRSSFCGSGSAEVPPLPLPHRLFDLESNLAKKFCPFPNVDLSGEVAL